MTVGEALISTLAKDSKPEEILACSRTGLAHGHYLQPEQAGAVSVLEEPHRWAVAINAVWIMGKSCHESRFALSCLPKLPQRSEKEPDH